MIKIGATLFVTAFLFLGCTATTPDHQPQHNHEASKDRYNDRVLNCARPDGHHVYEVQQQCPLNDEPFTALSLGTHSTMGRHLDWEPISYMRFPVALPICPSSGFVVQQSDYTTAEVAQLKTAYTSKTYQDLYSQIHASYFLYARALELAEIKQDQHWWLYLNATWEADNCGDRAKYQSYALSTIQEAQSSLQSAQISPNERMVLSIIIPNLYRRVGDFESARYWFSKIGTPNLDDEEANQYYSLAKDLLDKAIKAKNTHRVPIEQDHSTDDAS